MCQSHPSDQFEERDALSPVDHNPEAKGGTSCCDVVVRDDVSVSQSDRGAGIGAGADMNAGRSRVMIPFVVQRGPQLFLLAAESTEWVLAELRFDDATCTFVELRKVRYAWPREAFGALLSRVAVSGNIDSGLIEETADGFSRWLGAQFRVDAPAD